MPLSQAENQPNKTTKFKRLNKILLILVLIILVGLAYVGYQKYTQPEIKSNTNLSNLNKSNPEVGGNFNSPSSNPPKIETETQVDTLKTDNSKPQSVYYTGKIDGEIPFRIKLDFSSFGAGNIEYTGLEVYDSLSEHTLAIKARTVNNPSPDYCPDGRCNFTIQEFDSRETDSDKILALDKPVADFQGSFDVNDTKMNKILGIWTNADNTQKLKFELNRSEEFEIEDYEVLSVENKDKSLKLLGNGCGLLFNDGPQGYYSVSIGQIVKYIPENKIGDCQLINQNKKLLLKGNYMFGAKNDQFQYLIKSSFTSDACGKSGPFDVYQYDIAKNTITLLGSYKYNGCAIDNSICTTEKIESKDVRCNLDLLRKNNGQLNEDLDEDVIKNNPNQLFCKIFYKVVQLKDAEKYKPCFAKDSYFEEFKKTLTHLSQPTPLALKSSNSPMVDFRALSKR